ncbi:MAG TPA: glycoside hydrolase family 38 C-terminal domain-containing protein, partial [Tepidisphaeraceae bacterium]|nr:glycoside hydrolase family 38 C-terminal domain-containing protein [Tepidisphaeraceae bacterium]
SACQKIVGDAADSMTGPSRASGESKRFVRVFNSTGFRRRDLARVEIAKGESLRVVDSRGQAVLSQVTKPTDTEAASLVFSAVVPSMGYATYELAVANGAPAARDSIVKAITNADGTVILETDLYSIFIDPARGGRISRLFSKDLLKDFVDPLSKRSFNEFRGYFPGEDKWLSSTDSPAQIEILEHGPLQAVVEIRGKIGQWPFVTRVSVAAGQRRIDFHTTFGFPPDTQPFSNRRRENAGAQPATRFRIGQPWEAARNTIRSNERPFYDSSFKLQALFPLNLKQPTLHKNAPFDVCRSNTSDTRFNSWDSIKHNLLMNWVDLLEQDGSAGMAVMTDHLTAYSFSPGEPFGIVMTCAGGGIWHDYGLGRAPSVSYAVVPHAGDWAKARLWGELSRWSEPLIAKRCSASSHDDSHWSFLDASGSGFEVTTTFVENGAVMIRLFNAEGNDTPHRITLDRRIRHVQRVELDGRTIEDVPVERGATGESLITVGMRRFAVQTLRCTLAPA